MSKHTQPNMMLGHRVAPNTRARLRFLRRELARFQAQAAFNREHYSAAEAFCWEASAADARRAIVQATGGQA